MIQYTATRIFQPSAVKIPKLVSLDEFHVKYVLQKHLKTIFGYCLLIVKDLICFA